VVTPEQGAVTQADDTLIDREPVVRPVGIEIAGYQVIVELPERSVCSASICQRRSPP
jgi:hypothetical protein